LSPKLEGPKLAFRRPRIRGTPVLVRKMNDPHVVALIYHLEEDGHTRYDKTTPLDYDHPDFRITISGIGVTFQMKQHYSRSEDARTAVDRFLRLWEMAADLEGFPPGRFRLHYIRSEMIDRRPDEGPKPVTQDFSCPVEWSSEPRHPDHYPHPPDGLALTTNIEVLHIRYRRYWEQGGPLADLGYLCYTVLTNGKQQWAAVKKYYIEKEVIWTLSNLTAEKGGRDARKAKGISSEFSAQERKWIEHAVNALMKRAAQVARDPDREFPCITMKDLPKLR
jgi:hypothetical protein